jgi:hypothetical protein
MSSTKVYTYGKTGQLHPSRMNWTGMFPDADTFGPNGYRKLGSRGGEHGTHFDVYTNGKAWIFVIWAFEEYVATIKTTDPVRYLDTLKDLSSSCIIDSEAMDLVHPEEEN